MIRPGMMQPGMIQPGMIQLGVALGDLLAVLNDMKINYFIGGSVASATFGLPRQTNDVDIVADLTPETAQRLCASLAGTFYADPDDASAAVRSGRAFNAIHLRSAYKFDIFPVGANEYARSELSRAQEIRPLLPGFEALRFRVCSPEDTILSKLLWFRRGGEVSERQWRDILGVINVQRERLDTGYLNDWATRLGVGDLLNLAMEQEH